MSERKWERKDDEERGKVMLWVRLGVVGCGSVVGSVVDTWI